MTFFGFVSVAFKRLTSSLGLTLLLILSVALTIGLMVCVPVFSGGVSRLIMQEEFSSKRKALNRPIFPVRFFARPGSSHAMTLADAEYSRDWIADMLVSRTGLPIRTLYMQCDSPFFQLRPRRDDTKYSREYLDAAKVSYVEDVQAHIGSVAGEPFGSGVDPNTLTVWVETHFADELALQVGDRYVLSGLYSSADEGLPVLVAGFFEASDPDDHFWHTLPQWHFNGVLLTTYEQYERYVYPLAEERTAYNTWYYTLDDTKMNLNRAPHYVQSLRRTERDVSRKLPGGGMDTAPTGSLIRGHNRKTALSFVLLGFSVPLIGILIYFIGSVATMIARSQGQEMAMLISRGSSRFQVLALMCLETLVLLGLAAPLGIGLGMLVARLMGYSLSFLTFIFRKPLAVHWASIDWRLVGAGALASLLARLMPTWFSTQFSIVHHERRQARGRALLSVTRVLFILILSGVTYYAHRQLDLRGSLGLVSWDPSDPSNDPLLLLAPSLFLFVAPLIAAELFVFLMRPLVLVGRLVPSITAYMGSLSLGREGGQYRTPVYMLILCLSLGVFYASLATSADIWSVDQRRYEIGADLTFGFPSQEESGGSFGGGETSEANPMLLPASDFEKVVGVEKAMPVGEYQATVPMGRTTPKMRLLGIDRVDFAQVAYFRSDFSSYPLGELMNRLGATPNGVLLPVDIVSQLQLSIGEPIRLNFSVDGNSWYPFEFEIVGTFSFFPTMYREEAPTAITNLSYLQMQAGGSLPYGIWIRLEPDADAEQVLQGIRRLRVAPEEPQNLQEMLDFDQNRLERVGIFGMLSVCFLAGALLSGLGLLVYSFLSLTRRSLGFAILQAIGMRRTEVMRMFSVEYLVILLCGLGVGVLLGITASQLYVPFFPITDKGGVPIPPFVPHVDWAKAGWISAAMGLTLIIIEVVVMVRLARARVFELLRLGTRE